MFQGTAKNTSMSNTRRNTPHLQIRCFPEREWAAAFCRTLPRSWVSSCGWAGCTWKDAMKTCQQSQTALCISRTRRTSDATLAVSRRNKIHVKVKFINTAKHAVAWWPACEEFSCFSPLSSFCDDSNLHLSVFQ